MDFDPASIVTARHLAGWSQAELAAAVGVSRGTIANTESGVSIPRSDVLGRIAHALGVPVESLFTHAPEAARAVDGAIQKNHPRASTPKKTPVGNATGA